MKVSIIDEVKEKVIEQESIWGSNTEPDKLKEVYGWGEVLEREYNKCYHADDSSYLRKQLIDLAGVAVSYAEALDASGGESG